MYFLLRIISNFRGIKTEDQEESERLFKLVDVIKDDKEVDAKTKNTEKSDTTEPADQITCNGVPLVKLAEEEYVYDVYTMQSDAMSSTGTYALLKLIYIEKAKKYKEIFFEC